MIKTIIVIVLLLKWLQKENPQHKSYALKGLEKIKRKSMNFQISQKVGAKWILELKAVLAILVEKWFY